MVRVAFLIYFLLSILPVAFATGDDSQQRSQITEQHIRLHEVGIDWMGGVRYGIQHPISETASIRSHIGVTFFGLITADLLGALRVAGPPDKLQLTLLAGIPNAAVPFTMDGAMVSFGGSIELRFFPWRRAGLAFRLGAGYPFFIEYGRVETRSISLPFNLWPDALIAIVWPR